MFRSQNSSVSIERGYGLDDWCSIPGSNNDGIFSHRQTGSGVHPASYPMGTGGSSPQE
jgi:hypothetical protein